MYLFTALKARRPRVKQDHTPPSQAVGEKAPGILQLLVAPGSPDPWRGCSFQSPHNFLWILSFPVSLPFPVSLIRTLVGFRTHSDCNPG